MNRPRPYRRPAALLLTLAATLAGFGSSTAAALAQPWPQHGPAPTVHHVDHVHKVVTGGTPTWQTSLIALTVALVAATAAVMADRARSRRRQQPAAADEPQAPACDGTSLNAPAVTIGPGRW
jgi:hypothetical protein